MFQDVSTIMHVTFVFSFLGGGGTIIEIQYFIFVTLPNLR